MGVESSMAKQSTETLRTFVSILSPPFGSHYLWEHWAPICARGSQCGEHSQGVAATWTTRRQMAFSREHCIPIVDIYPAIYDFLSTQGYSKSARAFAEEALLAVPPARRSFGLKLTDLAPITGSKRGRDEPAPIAQKKAAASDDDDSDDDDDDSEDDDSDEDVPAASKAPSTAPAAAAAAAKPAAAAAAKPAAAAAKPAAKKADDDDDDDDDSDDDSDDDDDDDDDDSDDDDDDDSDEDDDDEEKEEEEEEEKEEKTEPKKEDVSWKETWDPSANAASWEKVAWDPAAPKPTPPRQKVPETAPTGR